MVAALGGLGTTCLGPDLPAAPIADAAARSSAQVVVVGLTFGATQPVSMGEVHSLVEQLPPSIKLWLGGPLPPRIEHTIPRPGLVVLRDFPALEAQLLRIGSRL